MKQFLILLLVPSMAFGAYTEFYMQSGGNNVNAGSTNNNTAAYTSTNGNWSTVTHNFTPTDGTTPASTVSVGDFASLYNDGATTAVHIARVTAVAAGVNGAITVSTTAVYGSAPSTSATGRSIKVGGAWAGPSGAATFPWGLSGALASLLNTSSNYVRINAKNNQTYTVTSQLDLSTQGASLLQGYSSSTGDGGKAIFTSNTTSGSNFLINSSVGQTFADITFANTGASNSSNLVGCNVTGTEWFRCVFHGARGSGFDLSISGGWALHNECEAYDDNKSNTASLAGFSSSNGVVICVNCYSHDHASGTNAHGYVTSSSIASMFLFNSIADTCAGSGMLVFPASSSGPGWGSFNSDFYNNTGDGIKYAASVLSTPGFIVNSNFTKNGGKGVNNTLAQQSGWIYNNGRGAGTEANGSTDTLNSIYNTSTDVTYGSNSSPYSAPTTGNFSLTLTAAFKAGRGAFTETDGTNTGTVGYPDIGSAQSSLSAVCPTPTATATATPTATATATATPVTISHTFGG